MRSIVVSCVALAVSLPCWGQTGSLVGDWREPGGSAIRIAPCGAAMCAHLIQISPQAPTPFDIHDPDPAKRSQRLCGLRIGYDFQPTNPSHAEGGQLYDPRNGKTYHGEMTSEGDTLHLRGYVGLRMFGRTEDWTRISSLKTTCG